jgi:16S rRNA (guanine966-N2)-methyltransferase
LRAGPNQVRIIGGRHRGRRLRFVPGAGLRPTPDRVRETLFNWLRDALTGARCLDLFAGSGVLGFEALSRGAASLLAVERHRAAAARLRENAALLGEAAVEVVHGDALKLLREPPAQPFDLAFVDPPFGAGLLGEACARLERNGWLAPAALVYLEQDASRPWPPLPGNWCQQREGRAGQSAQRLLQRSISA